MAGNASDLRPSDDAKPESLDYGRRQGEAMQAALRRMLQDITDGGEVQHVADYLVAQAVEKAEGLWMARDGRLTWVEPEQ